jgi:hypothetical protein
MEAKIQIPNDFDFAHIVKEAGQSNINKSWYDGTTLTVKDVSQSLLEDAVQKYNHLEHIKSQCIIEVNLTVGCVRDFFLTPINAQILVCMDKFEEAVDYMAANCPENLSTYPYIKAESEALQISPTTVASNILKAKQKWTKISASVEKIRLTTKLNIQKSSSVKETLEIKEYAIKKLNDIMVD